MFSCLMLRCEKRGLLLTPQSGQPSFGAFRPARRPVFTRRTFGVCDNNKPANLESLLPGAQVGG